MDNIYKGSYRANPRENASWLSIWFFWYTIDMFVTGNKTNIGIKDLYNPLKCDKSEDLGFKLERNWKLHVNECIKRKSKPSLLVVTAKTFFVPYAKLGCLLAIMELVLRLIQPHMLGKLLDYFRRDSQETSRNAILYASLIVGCNGFYAMFANQYLMRSFHAGFQVRTAFCSLIYRKSLKLSTTALGETASGKAVNLLSNDVSRFDVVSVFLNHIWVAPITAIFVMYFLWTEVGLAGIIGTSMIFLVVPLQSYTGKLSSKFRLQTAYKTDERVRLIDEVISAIQVIKIYAWEIPYSNLIKLSRKAELNVIKKTSYVRGLYMTFNLFTTRVALYGTLMAMVFMNQSITASKVFMFAAYFNILSNSMGSMFVRGISEVAEVIVSMRRLQNFLQLEEIAIKNDDLESRKNRKINPSENFALKLNNVSANYNSTTAVLNSISLGVYAGELVAIIGPVGSGKSSVFQLLLNELNIASGNIIVNGSISYASQEAWVFGGTIRQNILFGSGFDKEHYERVVKACALQKDFKQFPKGDLTVIGERGSSLSGGQKARINLARAVYRNNADIYLLDDPLSAVDSHVANHLFHKCINGLLKKKTRVLVTHQVQFLKGCDQIFVINKGRLEAKGTYQEIVANSAILHDHLVREDDEKNDEKKHKKRLSTGSTKSDISMSVDDLNLFDYGDVSNIENYDNDESNKIERTSKGSIKGSLSLKYFRSGSNAFCVLFVAVLFVFAQAAASGTDFWVSFWCQQEELHSLSIGNRSENNQDFRANYLSTEICMNIYTVLIIALFIIALARSLFFYSVCMKASYYLHNAMMDKLLRTNMYFFNTNPSGRIINRFSKDFGGIDEILPKTFLDSAQILLSMIGSLVLASLVNIYFLIPVFIMGILIVFLRNIYLKTSKNLKRLEGITRSPIFTHLNTTLKGLVTIRAYGTQEVLKKEFDQHQDLHSSACWMFIACSSAFGFILDTICFLNTTLVVFSFLWIGKDYFSDQVGLAITQTIALTSIVQWGFRQSAEVSNQLMSVERVLEYTNLPSEENERDNFRQVSAQWPQNGKIRFANVNARYSDESLNILKNLSFVINAKEKIGIVGRTGAGKSSIIQTLFRLIVYDGTIEIDNIDISKVQLSVLRSKISIIPQDPVLFSGTLRRNLDPFEEFPDYKIWKALEEVMDRGANFSVGERQLICLARAIVRNSQILLLDEATANVDLQTDNLIQKTIREKFRNCTVLTIAHRLNTIMDSDRVLVIDKGTLIEFDQPYQLLQIQQGHFAKMVYDCGPVIAKQLILIAKKHFDQ